MDEAAAPTGVNASTLSQHPANKFTPRGAAGGCGRPPAESSRAEAMAAYTRAVLEPLVDALERSYARTCELERENGVLTERLAGLERVRDAALAYIEELEVTSAQKSDVQTKALPAPVSPSSGTMPRRREPRWRRWVRQVVLGR